MQFSKLFKNAFSLTLVQAVNYLLPILILPYLVKKVGIVNFGLASYAIVFFMPAKIFIEYGFGLSGVKEIAANCNDKIKLGQIVSKITITKIYLLVSIVLLFLVISPFVSKINTHFALYLVTLITVIGGQSIIPVWFFQGMERTKILLIGSVISRGCYLLAVFFFINKPDDYLLINLFLGISEILLSFFCLYYILKIEKIEFKKLNFKQVKAALKDNLPLAKTNFYTMTSLSLPFTILGFVASETTVGYYSIADKILQVIRTSAAILYNSAFPRVINLYKTSQHQLASFSKKFTLIIVVIYLPIFFISLFFSEYLIKILINDGLPHFETSTAIKIMAIIPLIAALDIIPSLLLLTTSQYKLYAKILFYSCIISVTLSIILVNNFDYVGAALTSVIVEICTLMLLLKYNYSLLKKLFWA